MPMIDNQQWVTENFSACKLGHITRTERLVKVAANMLDCPDSSLPKQNTDWADLKAAYRLLDRDECTLGSIAGSHWEQTRQKGTGKRCLLLCDTTDLSYYSHKATEGLGMLGDGKGVGLQLHSCLMIDRSTRQVIGQAGAMTYYRKRVPEKETRAQRLARTRESDLWGDLVDVVGPRRANSHWTYVFDRGGDNFDAMCRIQKQGCHWIIRAGKLNRKVIDSSGKSLYLRDAIRQAKVLGTYELFLRSRPGQAARTAKLRVSVTTVTLPRPAHLPHKVRGNGIRSITSNVVIVEEFDTPKGVTPIQWVLLTDQPAETFAQAWEIVECYEQRWLIEEYHKVLKTGCNIEGHALRTAARLEAMIGIVVVIGIRLLSLKMEARTAPETPAKKYVPSTWLTGLKGLRKRVQLTELTVYQFFRELARVGGFLARKGDGEPGWQTIWYGYRKLQMVVTGIEIAHQQASKRG